MGCYCRTSAFLAVIAGVEALGYKMRRQRSGYCRWGVGYIVQRGAALLYLLGLGDIVMGQGNGNSTWDPVKTVCNIAHARGVILGDKMYVDGGQIMDQQYYLFGIDKPCYNSAMDRWQSGFPSKQCPHII